MGKNNGFRNVEERNRFIIEKKEEGLFDEEIAALFTVRQISIKLLVWYSGRLISTLLENIWGRVKQNVYVAIQQISKNYKIILNKK